MAVFILFVCLVIWTFYTNPLFEEPLNINIDGLKKVSKVDFPEGTKLTNQRSYSWLESHVYARLEVPTDGIAGLFLVPYFI